MKKVKIHITKAERKRVEEFADKRCESTSLYQKRGGFKRVDIVSGGMAEIAAYKFLREHGFKVNKPDFTIHSNGKKSYDADLIFEDKHFHVKGQTYESVKLYGESWLMQRNDKLVKEPLINNYLIPSVVDVSGNSVYIMGVPSFTALHNGHCFGECANPWFSKTKVAIYAETLATLTSKALWGALRGYNKGRN